MQLHETKESKFKIKKYSDKETILFRNEQIIYGPADKYDVQVVHNIINDAEKNGINYALGIPFKFTNIIKSFLGKI